MLLKTLGYKGNSRCIRIFIKSGFNGSLDNMNRGFTVILSKLRHSNITATVIINESIFSEIFISACRYSLALSLTMFAAPVMGHLSEKFGCRLVTLVGMLSGIVGLVHVATSFVNNIEVMFFTHGILVGLGACCGRTSCFLVVAKYFNKKRSFATGSVTMGPSLGVFMWGPVAQVLLDSVGWRNTFRVLALGCCLVIYFSPLPLILT